mmetsp:Transcript_35231/g.83559  ORF Transcript_35231/g.83559 Transcript_35231/m.83559 type:complete len:291 (+) Transcript_35231:108-980(+)
MLFARIFLLSCLLCIVPVYCEGVGSPRVAVCFFGLTRSLRKFTFGSIQRYLLNQLSVQGYFYDVYVHTFNITTITNSRSREYNTKLDPEEFVLLNPRQHIIDDPSIVHTFYNFSHFKSYGNAWPRDANFESLRNMILQSWSLKQCVKLVDGNEYMKYMYYIFARPDVMFRSPGLPSLRNLNLTNNSIALAYIDRFAAGFPQVVKTWARRLESAQKYVETGFPLHSEKLVLFHLKRHRIRILRLKMCFDRVRANGIAKLDCLKQSGQPAIWSEIVFDPLTNFLTNAQAEMS